VPKWDPGQYLRFERERTLPSRDLLARLGEGTPATIIDLGCGTGTSTALLRDRWPAARVVGVDSSLEMIAAARKTSNEIEWVVRDVRSWSPTEPFDLVFSNAALQWVPDHRTVFPHLLRQVAPGGTLAVQMPANFDSPVHRRIREVADAARWSARWGPDLVTPHVESVGFYYDLLTPESPNVECWITEYIHVLPAAADVVEWVKGTALRPYLDRLPEPTDREEFLAEILKGAVAAYPPRADGQVLFPFRRLFLVARRSNARGLHPRETMGETGM
jgi:trans-aconitate 2-methyltransferase